MSLRETINSTTPADRILLFILISLCLSGFVFIKHILPQPHELSIEVDGKALYKYPLETDRIISVKSLHGSLNVEIKDKKVRVFDASCPNKQCEHQGWISSGAIICLPNRISITVGGAQDSGGKAIDAITG